MRLLDKELSKLEKFASQFPHFYEFLKKCKVKYQQVKYFLFKAIGKEKETIKILRSLGVKYAIVHLSENREGNNREAVDIIGEISDFAKSKGLRLLKKFGDDEVCEIIIAK